MKKTRRALAVAAMLVLPALAGAKTVIYSFNLDANQEVPPNASPAAGSAQLIVDDTADTLSFALAAFNLQGSFAASHIHEAPAGVNGGVVYNFGTNADAQGVVTVGGISIPNSYSFVGDGKPISSLADDINAMPWNYYVNLHTSLYPGGEIRGQLAPIPEPASVALLALGLGVVGVLARRRKPA